MPRAILKKGRIVPLEPLPPEWEDGSELEIRKATECGMPPEEIDSWAKEMAELCADSPLEEEKRMRDAIEQHRRQAKAQMRREMGFPE
jgi:hypothetical protein